MMIVLILRYEQTEGHRLNNQSKPALYQAYTPKGLRSSYYLAE